ncbi:MAG: hypothetical protein FWD57_08080 [Polyangiaceae bacterium]|nr:hypothetical protein [Polyangiaceae bacterium]
MHSAINATNTATATHGLSAKLTAVFTTALATILAASATACTSDDESAFVAISNDFDNPNAAFQPPWTICRSSYRNVEFGKLAPGDTSAELEVDPGLDFVLMVAAWNDPTCSPNASLPIASKQEEEVVDGQHRTIAIGLANHQGACPPEGVAPIPEAQYNRIVALWPDFGFLPYAERLQNQQCLPNDLSSDDRKRGDE